MGRRRKRGRRGSSVKNNKVDAAIGAGTAVANQKRSINNIGKGLVGNTRPQVASGGKRGKGAMGALDVAGLRGSGGGARDLIGDSAPNIMPKRGGGNRKSNKLSQRPLPRRGPEGSRTRNPFARPTKSRINLNANQGEYSRPERGYGMGREQRGLGMGQTEYAQGQRAQNRGFGMGDPRVRDMLGRQMGRQQSFVSGDQKYGRGGFGGYGDMGEFGGRDPLGLGTMSEQQKPTKRRRGRGRGRLNLRDMLGANTRQTSNQATATATANSGSSGNSGSNYGVKRRHSKYKTSSAISAPQANLEMQAQAGPGKKAGTKQGAFKLPKKIKKNKKS